MKLDRLFAVGLLGVGLAVPTALADTLASGIALYQQGKFAEAEAALQGAAGAEAQAYLAASRVRQRKFAPAEEPARAAVAALPTHDVAVAALGGCLVGLQKYDDAVAAMSAALEKQNDLAYAYYWRGMAYNGKKDAPRAIEDLNTFLKLAPKAPEADSVRQVLATLG